MFDRVVKLIGEDNLDDSIEFIKTAIDLYEKTHTLFQVNEDKNKLEELEGFKKVQKKDWVSIFSWGMNMLNRDAEY